MVNYLVASLQLFKFLLHYVYAVYYLLVFENDYLPEFENKVLGNIV